MVLEHQKYIRRCFDLARLAGGRNSPNPMVGAVLVYQNRIIGEGFHTAYGQAHAEVEAVRSVAIEDRAYIPASTLYVSLEPCSIHGRTPPCTDLILREGIKKVILSHVDHTPGVNGQGIALLRKHGVAVTVDVLSEAGDRLSRPRNVFVRNHRPYIILKYAQSQDGYIAPADGQPYWLSNPFSKRLVHRWRSEVDAIMVGTNTAAVDNPQLTTRLYPGPSPTRVVLDLQLRLPNQLNVFDGSVPTLVYTQQSVPGKPLRGREIIQVRSPDIFKAILADLQTRKIQTLMVEGGRLLLETLIEQGLWDEARVFTVPKRLKHGIAAPILPLVADKQYTLQKDRLEIYYQNTR